MFRSLSSCIGVSIFLKVQGQEVIFYFIFTNEINILNNWFCYSSGLPVPIRIYGVKLLSCIKGLFLEPIFK